MNHALRSLTTIFASGIFVLVAANPSFSQTACEAVRVTASDSGVFESFGFSVAVFGDTALVGAEWDSELGTQAGAVYVFRVRSGPPKSEWVEVQKLLASDGASDDVFGYAIAMEGETALIGAPGHVDAQAPGTGSAFVFRFNGSSWTEDEELFASDGMWQDGFGASVSISGDVAVIGAVLDDDKGPQSGSAYVFRFDPKMSRWIEEQKLLASDGAAGDFFGTSVAVSGDLVVIGANGDDDNGTVSGSAYVFRYDPLRRTWVEEQKLLASDGAEGDEFGVSVSISGETVLIGARLDGAGSAYVFRFDPQTVAWVQEQKLVASDPTGADQFGRAVAIDGDTAVIGAWVSDAGGIESGAAYIFRFDPKSSQWVQQQQLLPEPNPWLNFFGRSVAIEGNTVVIGAHGEDHQAGATYIYDLAACLCPADLDGDGNVGILDLLSLLAAWGTDPGGPPDFDNDGAVGILDLLELLANWGPCP
ncbi:MAG: hypothetical protein IH983_11260 [Planctomycetes bacterium]|nr:hypothetical protein [Planctomycetota bacterium]